MTQTVKNLPAIWETWVRSLDWEDSLEEGMATPLQYSGLENAMGSQRVGPGRETFMHTLHKVNNQ